jgi:hypothetical protein
MFSCASAIYWQHRKKKCVEWVFQVPVRFLLRPRKLLYVYSTVWIPHYSCYSSSLFKVRKSMARIKYVINERRRAYLGAQEIYSEAKEEFERKGRWTRARKQAAKQAEMAAYKGRQRELAKKQALAAAQNGVKVAEEPAAPEVEAEKEVQVEQKEEVAQVEEIPKAPTSARGRAADGILS